MQFMQSLVKSYRCISSSRCPTADTKRQWLFLRLDPLQVLLVNLLLPAARLSAGRQLPTAWHCQLGTNRLNML
jgi:hypothetical protein